MTPTAQNAKRRTKRTQVLVELDRVGVGPRTVVPCSTIWSSLPPIRRAATMRRSSAPAGRLLVPVLEHRCSMRFRQKCVHTVRVVVVRDRVRSAPGGHNLNRLPGANIDDVDEAGVPDGNV